MSYLKKVTRGAVNVRNAVTENPIASAGHVGVETLRAAGLRKQSDKLKGILRGDFLKSGGDGPKSTVGDQIPMPVLADRKDLASLGEGGIFKASTISNQQIADDMNNSPWFKMAKDKQAAEQNLLLSQANKNSASGLANARSSLAMRGGLRGGSAERLAGMSGNDLAMQRQNVLGQGAVERGNLGMQAAGLSGDIARFNAGQTQQAQFGNVQNQIADLGALNDQNRFKYGEEMKMKGAGMSSQAIANSGGKGGLLGFLGR